MPAGPALWSSFVMTRPPASFPPSTCCAAWAILPAALPAESTKALRASKLSPSAVVMQSPSRIRERRTVSSGCTASRPAQRISFSVFSNNMVSCCCSRCPLFLLLLVCYTCTLCMVYQIQGTLTANQQVERRISEHVIQRCSGTGSGSRARCGYHGEAFTRAHGGYRYGCPQPRCGVLRQCAEPTITEGSALDAIELGRQT